MGMRLIDADALKKAIPNTHVDIFENCRNCRLLDDEQVKQLIDDAPTIELLKEREAVVPYMDFDGHDVWRCGKCGATIFHIYHNASDEDAKNYAKFCRHCGRSVKWE